MVYDYGLDVDYYGDSGLEECKHAADRLHIRFREGPTNCDDGEPKGCVIGTDAGSTDVLQWCNPDSDRESGVCGSRSGDNDHQHDCICRAAGIKFH